jgi:sRNA-binding carbon storage regulator CsrA
MMTRSRRFLMLVLSRRKRQSVYVGDEITLTVEEICDSGNGDRIFSATAKLGFQTPPYVAIWRSELQARPSLDASPQRMAPQTKPRAGKIVDLADAQVRLRIQVPCKVPVCHNGTPSDGHHREEESCGENHGSQTVHYITCRKNDRIAICKNIIIAAIGFQQFIPQGQETGPIPCYAANETAG